MGRVSASRSAGYAFPPESLVCDDHETPKPDRGINPNNTSLTCSIIRINGKDGVGALLTRKKRRKLYAAR